MYRGKKIAVVVPAYNEERLLPQTLAGIPGWVDLIIVVDDASKDSTFALAKETQREGLTAHRHIQNKGVGASITTGYRLALQQGAELVAVMAGDAQMDPVDLPRLLDPLVQNEADYTKGDRLSHPDVFRVMPWSRLIGSFLLSLATRPLSGFWGLSDSQCGYTAITQEALSRIDLGLLYPRYGYPNDLLIQLGTRGLRSKDVTVRPVYGDEVSGFRPHTVAPKILFVLGRALLLRLCYHLRV